MKSLLLLFSVDAQDVMEDTYRARPLLVETQQEVGPCDRDVWRSNVKSAMCAASQLPGGEPTDVDDAHAPAPAL